MKMNTVAESVEVFSIGELLVEVMRTEKDVPLCRPGMFGRAVSERHTDRAGGTGLHSRALDNAAVKPAATRNIHACGSRRLHACAL